MVAEVYNDVDAGDALGGDAGQISRRHLPAGVQATSQDTGWRLIPEYNSLAPALIRRRGPWVEVLPSEFYDAAPNGVFSWLLEGPESLGFRPSRGVGVAAPIMSDEGSPLLTGAEVHGTDTAKVVFNSPDSLQIDANYTSGYGSFRLLYSTDDPFPTVLPGTPA